MEINVTLSYISNNGNWDRFCEEKGIGYYACAEGYGDSEITLTKEEAIRYGLIKED